MEAMAISRTMFWSDDCKTLGMQCGLLCFRTRLYMQSALKMWLCLVQHQLQAAPTQVYTALASWLWTQTALARMNGKALACIKKKRIDTQ